MPYLNPAESWQLNGIVICNGIVIYQNAAPLPGLLEISFQNEISYLLQGARVVSD